MTEELRNDLVGQRDALRDFLEVEQLVVEMFQRRDKLPNRHHDVERFRLLVAAEERIDAAYLAMDQPALRRAVAEWQALATPASPAGV
jgi:hypothetical protein